jgi:hypothetical protein
MPFQDECEASPTCDLKRRPGGETGPGEGSERLTTLGANHQGRLGKDQKRGCGGRAGLLKCVLQPEKLISIRSVKISEAQKPTST